MGEGNDRYVVTFEAGPIHRRSQLSGLRRMTLADAQALIIEASRIPKRGRVVDSATLAVVV
jgi:hypothetical protein